MDNGFRQVYQFGSFRLDVEQSLLSRNGESVPLPPKIFEILVALVENSGRVLDKEELMRRIWPDTFVEENNLTVSMSALRKALEDGANGLKYIETVPRRGYRFVAPVSELMDEQATLLLTKQTVSSITIEEEEEIGNAVADELVGQQVVELPAAILATPTTSRRPSRTVLLLVTLGVVAVTVVVALWLATRTKPIQTISDVRSIAVLPFHTLGTSGNDESLELGLTDALITKLSNLNPVIVRPTSAILKYTNSTQQLSDIGRELNVEALLEGRVQRSGDRLRLTVQLVRTENGAPVWAESFDEQFTNIFAVQTAISERVSRTLAVKLTSTQRQQLVKDYTKNTEAFQLYIKGRYFWNKRSPDSIKKAMEYFEQAIELDPTYALAYAGLADCYITSGTPQMLLGANWDRGYIQKARVAAQKALEIDDTLAEAHTSLGAILALNKDDQGAHSEWDRAIELNPNYATVYSFYTIDLIGDGRLDEALEKINRAQEIDPLSVIINTNRGFVLLRLRRYDEAIEQFKRALEMNPDMVRAHWGLGLAYEQKGMYKEAIAEFERCVSLSNNSALALSALAHGYAVSGQRAEAQKILSQLNEMFATGRASSYYLAAVYVALGNKEQALTLLEQNTEGLNLGLLKVDAQFDPLRQEPRFIQLVQPR
jgi:DNA-binding winged helix-turn-helix (wHTH) protein/TolB-like protein/Flp pilus assembly protein TadD